MQTKTLAAAGIAIVATAIACSGPASVTGNGAAPLRTTGFTLFALARNCPATTPVTFGGPGVPAFYTVGFEVTIQNETADTVRIQNVAMLGSVITATDNVGLNRPAHVFASVPFVPNAAIAPDRDLVITGFVTVLCGDNPIMPQSTSWHIATTLNIMTDHGGIGTHPVTFRRSWSPCGGACPATQPALPDN